MLSALVTLFLASPLLSVHAQATNSDPFPYDPGFDISAVAALAKALPSHSWEYGTASETLIELYNSSYSVFGTAAFPVPVFQPDQVPALVYAEQVIVLGTGADGLSDGDGAVGDPASLGVAAVMLGKTDASFEDGAYQEFAYITGSAPRWYNGAISQRTDVPELWYDSFSVISCLIFMNCF